MNLHEKLVEVRKSVPYLEKDTRGYNYDYVSGTTVLSALKKKMDELGLLLIPSVMEYEARTMPIKEKGIVTEKPTVACKMLMTWVNAEKPDEKIEVPFACFGTQDDISKAFGSALTYSERYFLLKFFNIPTDKDDPDSFQKKNSISTTKEKIEKVSKKKEEPIQPKEPEPTVIDEKDALTEEQLTDIKHLQRIYKVTDQELNELNENEGLQYTQSGFEDIKIAIKEFGKMKAISNKGN